jgi:hypothetical protein
MDGDLSRMLACGGEDELSSKPAGGVLEGRPELLQWFDEHKPGLRKGLVEFRSPVTDADVNHGGGSEAKRSNVGECLRHRSTHPMWVVTLKIDADAPKGAADGSLQRCRTGHVALRVPQSKGSRFRTA